VNKRKWFLHFLWRSLSQRKGRVAVASASVMIAAAIVVSALGISLGIRQKLGGELRSYGANVIITPKEEKYLSDEVFSFLSSDVEVEDFSGQLYARVSVNGADVEMIGLDFKKLQGWRIEGRTPAEGEILIGTNIRDALGLKLNDAVKVTVGDRDILMKVSGFVERGGPEDNAVMLDLAQSQRLTGLVGKLSAVFVRVKSRNIGETVKALRDHMPYVNVKTLRQVAFAEESFLKKIELLMALVTLVVLVASGISVSSTMSATVLERLKEIGLMKAIGGTKNSIRRFYLAEGCIIGIIGGLSGYVLGFLSAQAVSKGAFGSFISIPFYVFFISLGMGVLIAVSSSILPVTDALRYKPSSILRGE
jgi:putative ABC transport system permease protein